MTQLCLNYPNVQICLGITECMLIVQLLKLLLIFVKCIFISTFTLFKLPPSKDGFRSGINASNSVLISTQKL